MRRIVLLSFVIVFACSYKSMGQMISTIAGTGVAGFSGDSSSATAAKLYGPYGVAVDASGNTYIIDQGNQRIRMVNGSGIITTIAGNGTAGFSGDSSMATSAELKNPTGIAVWGGNVYIADMGNNRIRKIDNLGVITTIAGTGIAGYNGDNISAVSAKLNAPTGVAVDTKGNIYIADRVNQRIRKIDTAGIITTIAGTGVNGYNTDNWPSATLADFSFPTGIATDNWDNVYVADQFNNRVRKIDTFGKISTVFGNGFEGLTPDGLPATNSTLFKPNGVAVDSLGNLYVSDEIDYIIRRSDFSSHTVITISGTGVSGNNGDTGLAKNIKIGDCKGIAVDQGGGLYFADWANNRVSHVTSTVSVSTVNENITGVSIYPNPNKGCFTVNVTSNNDEHVQLVITNVIGETVKTISTKTNKAVSINIDMAAGVYFVTATTAHGKYSSKLEIMAR